MDVFLFALLLMAGIIFIAMVRKFPDLKKRSKHRRLEEDYFRRIMRR